MTECYHTETDFRSGRRYIPVRRTDGELWLNTEYVAETAADALGAAMLSDTIEHHPDWVVACELVGVAEVDLNIIALHTLGQLTAVDGEQVL